MISLQVCGGIGSTAFFVVKPCAGPLLSTKFFNLFEFVKGDNYGA